MISAKPNAQQFFDIWCEAVPLAVKSIDHPGDALFWSQFLWSVIAVRYGSQIAEWAVTYLGQLIADVSKRGTI